MRSVTRHLQELPIVLVALSALVVACGGGLDGKPAGSLTPGATTGANSSASGSHGSESTTGTPSTTEEGEKAEEGENAEEGEDRDRPSFIQRIFGITPSERCKDVAPGSQDTALEIRRLGQLVLCIGKLNVLSKPVLTLVSPDGIETTSPGFRESPSDPWRWTLSAEFGGNLPDLGTYAFRTSSLKDNHGPPPTSLAPTSQPSPTAKPSPSTHATALASGQAAAVAKPSAAGLVTSGTITVLAAAHPTFAVEQADLRAGQILRVDLAGFHPAEDLYVSIYGPLHDAGADDAQTIPLLADVPRATADANGEAVVPWTVPPGTAIGRYAIWVDPEDAHDDISFSCQNACLSFRVTS